ncbi:MAG: type I restriction endonuclease, partial [Pirellula sp.]|nr:type I restriction endonuclease [Pirellula sp.]
MTIHTEINFENDICEHLAAHGWLYAEGDAGHYDRSRALFPADVVAWLQQSQPDAWDAACKSHGANAGEAIVGRLRDSINLRGTLDVLRNGFEVLGQRSKLLMMQVKPALEINSQIMARYAANRLRVIRQVRYSLHNENSIDLVLFLNGIPIATVELKTDFTQNIQDAIDQYRLDRIPNPKGLEPEPLLSFPMGALVHFAVSNSEVRMTTKLNGPNTEFLPFNLGDHGAAGNPTNPHGHRTAYLWEKIWERSSWLEIIGRYVIAKKDKKKQIESYIFPRYHQLDVTRKLQTAILTDTPGTKYLIQHSAGSGKTNSIAWTAHFLADLHDASNKKIFDSILVISDRNVIDGQLQDAIYGFQRTTGVVATIKGDGGSKSDELAEALSGDKKIIVCTIQTFPALQKKMLELTTQGKRFAVIADEAHSSQTGEAASKLKSVLSIEEQKELEDCGEVSVEDTLNSQMSTRASDGLTYIAFTATPKSKTIHNFGTRPDPSRKPAKDNVPYPFHVYSMRQAIEEGFILDVLQNYTSYKLAFKLANQGKEYDEKQVEKNAAMKGIMGWVRLHPYNISQKVQIIVEHFRDLVAPLLGGKAKAMVVVASRLEAVRWQLALQTYIADKGYPLQALVAFSGEVRDLESSPDPFTENSKTLNPNLKGREIREAFKEDQYQILLVANKFQTGFDQPLLSGMYIDKRLDGIQAVQTLSRLNRAYPGKDTTYVLDFVNEPDEILKSFQTYYTTATLSGVTDPNIVLDLRSKIDAMGHYEDYEVNRVVSVELDPNAKQAQLIAAITPVADRLLKQFKAARAQFKTSTENKDSKSAAAAKDQMDALILFRSDMASYQRLYAFLSQIFNYENTEFEKRSIFFKRLIPLLKFEREREGVDLSSVVLTHHNLKNRGKQQLSLPKGEYPKLPPMSDVGSGMVRDKQKVYLSEIIERVNDLFKGDLTENDKLVYVNNVLLGKLLESNTL